ncbi:MAG TPA: 2-oxoacid:acceptor oxidoreductase subunit alpha [Gemmatimonadaceae bacterium]|nr:2-oxoacid:acceptor oxidoreductase subunit alpha [Gemmatimonadota bacterium]HNV73619.1 2-oxoacid:acceptor oxidoreductase subunit alpha [Gemmatimonadaceae bacterium]HPV73413.1 2-oxoacid:acceptor oxidoreductase subunit alpha [Gemmatimonadaceae bacterium]
MSGINDFAFKMGTVNGTGSASANSLLMQAIFRMGIPVTGKNIFPSNIQGLPTWYEIRVSKDGYTARPSEVDLVVALNPSTYRKDVAAVRPGGYLLYDSTWPLDPALVREGITILGIPFGKMCVETFEKDRDRTLLRNIAYAGALAALLDIDMDVVGQMLNEKFAKKPRLLDANHTAIHLGYDFAKANFACPLPFRLEKMDATGDAILMDGNTASALGALYAGATVGAWYPITPATALMEAFKGFCEKFRVDPDTGLNNYAILQAEDELAAAGIVIGAGWAGARAFTNTSGPGISLMQEFIGLAYYTDIPAVFFDVQRCGPATGMPTRTQQADLFSLAYASHGDTKHLVLFPANPRECFELAVQSFDLAERFQTPVFVASDLDIGMNDWMVKRFEWDDNYRPDRGKVLDAEALSKIAKFSRYLDVDGDGIAARTLPGVGGKGAYFVRGSGHDKHAAYTEDSDAYLELVDRLKRKIDGAAESLPTPVIQRRDGAEVGLVMIGGCDAAVREAGDILATQGIAVDVMRIRAFPFAKAVHDFITGHEHVFVIEQNRDAQLRALLAIELGVPRDDMHAVLDYGGMPLTAKVVVDAVSAHLAGVPA